MESELSAFASLMVRYAEAAHAPIRSISGLRAVAHRLSAEFLVFLRLHRDDHDIWLSVQLVDAATGAVILAERGRVRSYDVIPFSQCGVLAQRMECTLVEHAAKRSRRRERRTAVDYYLLGNGIDPDDRFLNQKARRAFEMPLSLDDSHPLAWAGLAETYCTDAFLEFSDNFDATLDTALRFIERATALNPKSSRAAWVTGRIFHLRHEWELAEKALNHATSLNPNDADAQAMMGSFLIHVGRSEEAIPALKRSFVLNPLANTRVYWALGAAYYNLGQYQLAIDSLNEIIVRRPNFTRPCRLVAAAYAMMGRVGKAEQVRETRLMSDATNILASAGAYMGRTTRTQRDIDHLLTGFQKAGFPT
ncbi:MAG: hypothetical protein ACK5MQ_09860 [Pikeienuella sp.]